MLGMGERTAVFGVETKLVAKRQTGALPTLSIYIILINLLHHAYLKIEPVCLTVYLKSVVPP